jgi:hypothetical protein
MKSICTRFAPAALFLSLVVSLASLTLAKGTNSNGTDLTTNASVSSDMCMNETGSTVALVQVNVLITSTGSAAPALVEVSTDGGVTFTRQGAISDWSGSGRDKTAQTVLPEILPPTPTAFEVCAAQPGSNGNPDKSACADLTIVPPCCTEFEGLSCGKL